MERNQCFGCLLEGIDECAPDFYSDGLFKNCPYYEDDIIDINYLLVDGSCKWMEMSYNRYDENSLEYEYTEDELEDIEDDKYKIYL